MASFDPSPARRGLDALLARYPHFDVLSVERQVPNGDPWITPSPWVLVSLGQPSENGIEAFARWEFAIWKNTGKVYSVRYGEVSDDPIIETP